MDIKKLFVGGIVGGILYFGLGYLVYGKLLTGYMHDHPGTVMIERAMDDIQFLYLILGNLAGGFLLAYIFVKGNVGTAASGFMTGGIVGLLSSAGFDLVTYATTHAMSKSMMMADVAAATVMTAIVGAVIAMIMGMGKNTA